MPDNTSESDFPRRYYLLDILRGLASLAVVLSHYRHFFFTGPGTPSETITLSMQPFYLVFRPFYENGLNAVYLFFSLSGFIFFHLYHTRVKDREISPGKFFILRFSRLYPLHFLTLIIVAVLQLVSLDVVGDYTIYPYNDLKHFLLNLTFTSHWGFQDGWSFNAPVWSVSIEVLLYGVFFGFARKFGKSIWAAALMVVVGVLIMLLSRPIGLGVLCFFLGGLSSLVYEALRGSKLVLAEYISISVGAFLGALLMYYLSPLDAGAWPARLALYIIVFPTLILALACIQDWDHRLGHRMRAIGDITYSTYLLHFPLQVCIILSISYFGLSVNFLSLPAFFGFLVAVVVIGMLSFKYVEMPSQKYLRGAGQRLLARLDPAVQKNPR